ncbi:MAG: DUF2500 domain-containing protein [Ignavibacteriales bacterium]
MQFEFNAFNSMGLVSSGIFFLAVLVFILVLCVMIFIILKNAGEWIHSKTQPVLSVNAKVVAKRENVSSAGGFDSSGSSHFHTHVYTDYYLTFELENGDRIEFRTKGKEFGKVAEGDAGILTYQGIIYLGFKRQ